MATRARNTSWSGDRSEFPYAVRKAILKRDRTCRACGQVPATQADHVVPVAEARLMGWTQDRIDHISNGQGLCKPCHDEKTRSEIARGRARMSRKRSPEPHPGLLSR